MFATIYLPNFYLQAALRHQPELQTKPVALIEEQERKPVIIQLNHGAESVGVRKGMTPSQALARYLQVVIKARAHAHTKKRSRKFCCNMPSRSARMWKQPRRALSPFNSTSGIGILPMIHALEAHATTTSRSLSNN